MTVSGRLAGWVALAAFLAVTPALYAQEGLAAFVGPSHASLVATPVTGGTVDRLEGTLLGGEGGVAWRHVVFRIGYAQGVVRPAVAAPGINHVEGFLLLGGSPIAGLEIAGGPRVRANYDTETTRRSVLWRISARYDTPILGPVHGYADMWGALGGAANGIPGPWESGRGGSAGISVRIRAFSVRVGYAVDEIRMAEPGLRETAEYITCLVGVGRP